MILRMERKKNRERQTNLNLISNTYINNLSRVNIQIDLFSSNTTILNRI